MYFNNQYKTAILLHRPFGIGADSRLFVQTRTCILRLTVAEILRQIVSQISNVTRPNLPNTVPNAAIHATHYTEVNRFGLRGSKKAEQVKKRDVLTSPGVNAIRQSNVSRHIPDRRYPVAICNRRLLYYRVGTPEGRFSIDSKIVQKAIIMLSHMSEEGDDDVLASVGDRLEKDVSVATASNRWTTLIKACAVNSSIRAALESYRERSRQNSGNADAVGKTTAQLKENQTDLQQMMGQLSDTKTPFWIRNQGSSKWSIPPSLKNDVVLTNYAYEGARTALDIAQKGSGKKKMIFKWNSDWKTKKTTNGGTYVAAVDPATGAVEEKGFVKVIMGERDPPATTQPRNYKAEKELMMGQLFDTKTPFWIRNQGRKKAPIPPSLKNEIVLTNYAYEGAETALKTAQKGISNKKMIFTWNPDWPDKETKNPIYEKLEDDADPKNGYVKVVMDVRNGDRKKKAKKNTKN